MVEFTLKVCILNGLDEEWTTYGVFEDFWTACEQGEKALSLPNHTDYSVVDLT